MHQSTGNVRQQTLETEMEVVPWGVLSTRPFGFHRGDRKAQPQIVAELYQKTPAEIEALKR
jgi:hypothetical protein